MTGIAYRPEIDGLRAIAVLAVVLYHAGFGFNAGLVGVDVFFVISGYLITSLLYREWETTGQIDLFAFYARRVRRIVPAMVVVVATVVVASAFLLSPFGEVRQVAQSGAASLLFVANFFFQAHTGGYFDPSAERMPLLHVWSLGVEEQFYLLWPLGLIAVLRWWRTSVFAVVAVCGLLSIALAEVLMYGNAQAAFYWMPARFWELALGGLVALRPAGMLADGRMPAAVGVIVVLAATIFPIAHFPGIGALPGVLGAGILLHAIHGSRRLGWAGAMLCSRPMVFFGLISYSLYLWHWPLFALERATHAGQPPLEMSAAICVAAVVLAWLSFRFVERPLRRPDPTTSNRKIVAGGLIVSLSLAYAATTLGNALHRETPPQDLASRTARDMPENRDQCHFRGDESLDVFPKPGCNSIEGRPVRVVIWGDSHALAWQSFAWAIAERQGVAATSYTRDACAPILDYDNGKRMLEAKRCREFNTRVASSFHGIDTLILAAEWPAGTIGPDFAAKLEATIQRVVPHAKRIILLGQTPYLHDAVPQCITSHDLPACAITRGEFNVQSDGARTLLRSIAAKYVNVEYVDLSDFFCNAQTCSAMKDGYGLYWDSNHVASTAVRAFTKQYLSRKSRDALLHRD